MKQHESADNSQGQLYIVPTPIGNLSDITQRALEVLQAVDLIAAEDTRHTGLLLQHFAINARLFALHDHNEQQKAETLLAKLKEGQNIALVSDAGTPLINDPVTIWCAPAAKRIFAWCRCRALCGYRRPERRRPAFRPFLL